MNLNRYTLLSSLLAISLCSLTAFADGASQSTSSDESQHKAINFSLPHVSVSIDDAPIEIKPWKVNANLGGGTQSAPQGSGQVFTIQIDASTRYPISFGGKRAFGTTGYEEYPEYNISRHMGGWDVEIQPGIHARIDASKLDSNARAQISRQDFTISGANLLHGWLYGNMFTLDPNDGYGSYGRKPTMSADLTFVNIGGKWFMNSFLHTEEKGLQLTVVEGSMHKAVRVFGVPMDFCAQMAAGAVLGKYSVGTNQTNAALFAEMSACAGVQIGSIAEIRDVFAIRYDNAADFRPSAFNLSVSNTVSIDHIGSKRNPLGVYWTNTRESAGSAAGTGNTSIVDNFFGIQGRF